MILPYVYKLTHKITGQFYFGYRSANKVPSQLDIGFKYFSSSKRVKEIGFCNFYVEIIAEFFNFSDAYDFEQQLIYENLSSELILNSACYINSHRFYASGKKRTKETRLKMSKCKSGSLHPRFGKPMPEEQKLKISKSTSGEKNGMYGKKHSQETKDKISRINSGRKRSKETQIKIYNKLSKFNEEEKVQIINMFLFGLKRKYIHELYKDRCTYAPINKIIRDYLNRSI